MKKFKESKIGIILLMTLLVIQFTYMIFWGTQKSGYYVDEFFTYDNTHYISASTPDRVKLYDADYMEYDKWFDVLEIKNTLMVQKEEALLQDTLTEQMRAFLNKPYMAILNYVEAIFFEGELNWWSSISINVVCFVLNQVLIYLIVMKISKNRSAALTSMALYGFCGMAVSMFVYVRMYMWLTFLTSLFTYLHALMWAEEKHWKNIVYEIFSMLVLFLAYNNSPLPVLYGAALIGCFSIGLIVRKKWVQTAYYSVPLILGGTLFAVFKTHYIDTFKNPQAALESGKLGAAEGSLVEAFVTLNGEEFVRRLENFMHMVCRFLFGHSIIVLIYLALVIAILIVMIKNKESIKGQINSDGKAFGLVMVSAIILYALASIAFDLSAIRYNSFVFPVIAVCAVITVFHMAQIVKKEKWIVIIGTVMILGEIFFTASIPRIENLYLEDRTGVEAIRQYKGIDSLVVDYHFDDKVMYECLAYTDENTKVMFTAYGSTDYSKLGDNLLVWQTVNEEDKVVADLLNAGYMDIHEIANTHESRVFLCKKQ